LPVSSAPWLTSSERAHTTSGHLELGRGDDHDAVEVTERLDQRLLLVGCDDDERQLLPPVREQRDGLLRRGLRE
jgi:hypothetical protein